jgi:uncharacterized membrane protein YedE/YeeE
MNISILHAVLGGVLIGVSAIILLYFVGRIAGISSILRGVLTLKVEAPWRYFFIAGLLLGGVGYQWMAITPTSVRPDLPLLIVILAGLLVGVGTSVGGGCTSGHGVCGLGRLSKRSCVATLTFVAFAMLTTTIARHTLELF